MSDAVIIDAVRTPFGDRDGMFRDTHPQDLAAAPLRALEQRNGFDPEKLEGFAALREEFAKGGRVPVGQDHEEASLYLAAIAAGLVFDLNSDAAEYGGSGIGNMGGFHADPVAWNERAYSLNLNLPPLGACIFRNEVI